VILYGVVAHVSIPDLFKAGSVRAFSWSAPFSVYGVYKGLTGGAEPAAFSLARCCYVLAAKWELLVPVVALFALRGFGTLTEAAAVTVVYVFVVETVIHRDCG